MVVVRKTVLDHEAAVLLQSKGTAKMNDKIIINNEGEAQPQQNNQLQNINGSNGKQKPRALLLCQPNSHPFQPRNIVFDPIQEVKVGRSITRTKIADNNAVFDCKVLSRNHAVIWYHEGKFFLRDTGSSNGTFINNQRLSSNSTSSDPYEIRTDDIIQFGVDVMENNKKETHGCIVALVKLFVGEGEEIRPPRAVTSESTRAIPSTDLCRLNQYLQEAIQREQVLETKLFNLQKIVESTRENSKSTWHAMIEEDRLLSRIDILENKLLYLQKNVTDDKLRDEMMKLLEEKCVYQNSAKEALRKIYQERNDAVQKLTTMERTLCSSEDECSLLRDQLLKNEENLQTAIAQLATTEEIRCELSDQLQRSDLRDSQKDMEIRNLYEQIKLQTQQNKELMETMETLTYEKDLLQERLKKLGPKRNTINNTIMSWMENSNLAGMASGKNIMNAICNEDDNEQPSLSETHEKLLAIEKQIASFEIQLNGSDKSTDSINHLENEAPLTSDGNQNNQQCPDEVILSKSNSSNNEESNNELNHKSLMKTTLNQLKEVCEELCLHVVSMKSNDDVKDKISTDRISEVDDEEDEDEDEEIDDNKFNKTDKDESRTNSLLESELQTARRIITELEEKLNAFSTTETKKVSVQTDTDELVLLNTFNDSCETLHHSSVENLNARKTVDVITQTNQEVIVNELSDTTVSGNGKIGDQSTHIDSDKSQIEHSLPDKNLDLGLSSVADDMKMLCDPNVEREEQLIAFKEHCSELTKSNLLLKNQLNELQVKLSNGHSLISTRLAVVAPIAIVIICWLILPYL